MSEKILQVDNNIHELKLGASFDPKTKVAFHSFRYDFKPASVDTSQQGQVEVGGGHQVTVSLPHVEGSGTSHTVYKGNKRPSPKECVLIIDHQTGTFTLERLSNTVNLKKTRIEGSSKITQANSRPLTPVDINKQKSPAKPKNIPQNVSPPTTRVESPTITPVHDEPKMEEPTKEDLTMFGFISDSDDSSSDSDNADSDSENESKSKKPGPSSQPQTSMFNAEPPTKAPPSTSMQRQPPPSTSTQRQPFLACSVSQDLQLSDTSDSDSD